MTERSSTTERLRRYWDNHAAGYDREMAFLERVLFEDGRAWACSQVNGDVLEVAIGTGRNLPFYPPDIQLTGVEFSPAMLDLARQRAQTLGRPVDLRLGDAQALDLPDASFDTVVCTLSLCGIPDERRAVAEMKRVLRPGGRLLLLDHIAASAAWARGIQWLLGTAAGIDTSVTPGSLRNQPISLVELRGPRGSCWATPFLLY